MDLLRIEGIIVKAIPFQDYDRIITVLTPSEGLIKFIFKGGARSKKGGNAMTTPLTAVELVYRRSRSELLQCSEISIINHHLALRNHLSTLSAACDMLQVVDATQMPGKPCLPLYQLLLAYLEKLPHACDPATLSGSFRLKTLRHEGLWKLHSRCNTCSCELSDSYLDNSGIYCTRHAPAAALHLSIDEKEIFDLLAFSRDLSLLASLPMTVDLTHKINHLFGLDFFRNPI